MVIRTRSALTKSQGVSSVVEAPSATSHVKWISYEQHFAQLSPDCIGYDITYYSTYCWAFCWTSNWSKLLGLTRTETRRNEFRPIPEAACLLIHLAPTKQHEWKLGSTPNDQKSNRNQSDSIFRFRIWNLDNFSNPIRNMKGHQKWKVRSSKYESESKRNQPLAGLDDVTYYWA